MKYFVLTFLVTSILYGQNDYRFKHFGTIDGLSQSSVIAIEQDRLGQIWFGTRDGLNKFDGNSIEVYRKSPENPHSISNNDILSLKEDSQGYLWVGTYNGLNRYDPINDTFKRFQYAKDKNTLSSNTIWDIKETDNGDIWLATSNGISVYHRDIDSFTNLNFDQHNPQSIASNHVVKIVQSEDGTIWAATSKGLCRLTSTSNGVYKFKNYSNVKGIGGLNVQDILFLDEHHLYVATRTNGVLTFDITTERFSALDTSLPFKDIRSLLIDDKDNLWLGTNSGIVIVDSNGKVTILQNELENPIGLGNNHIKILYMDRKNSIWIGTYNGGVSMWDNSNTNFVNYSSSFSKYKLNSNVVGAMEIKDSTQLYVGTEGGGVGILDLEQGYTHQIVVKNNPEFSKSNIKSMLFHDNELWIGSQNQGVWIYNTHEKLLTKDKVSLELQEILHDVGVYSIIKGEGDNYWLGTFGKGLILYNTKEESFKSFIHDIDDENTIPSDFIRAIHYPGNGSVWVGTTKGISHIQFANGPQNFHITNYLFDKQILSGHDVQTIFQDGKGTIWIGVKGEGLFQYDGTSFKPIPIDVSSSITSIQAILEDGSGHLWMSTNNGITKYDPKKEEAVAYNQSDGLVGNEFSNSAAVKMSNDVFFFGGTSGLTSFRSNGFTNNEYAPQVVLTGFKVKDQFIKPLEDNEILTKSITNTDHITLKHNNANFSIHYAIPNFINPQKNSYKYRLVGLEEEWNKTHESRVNYTIQRPGDYIFQVLGANNDGVWNTVPTQLKITVEPAPWRSGLAFFIYAALILSAVLGLVQIIRSRTKLKHQLDLEHVKNEQMKMLNKSKLEFFTNISHEFRTPLTLISGPLQQLLEDYKGSSFMYKKLLVIESNANHLLQLINRLMDFRKLENKQHKLETAEGNFIKFLHEIYLSFTEFAKLGKYSYKFITNETKILLFYDRPKLEQVFYNLISNAFRYTPEKGEIKISVKTTNHSVIVEVVDSGPGIPEEYQEKVFERFFEVPDRGKEKISQKGTGIGLAIAKHIVEMHSGSIKVSPKKVGEGAMFRVELPLGSAHLGKEEIIDDFKYSEDIRLYNSQLLQYKENKQLVLDAGAVADNDAPMVLLVEDNTELRQFIKDLLKDKYRVIEAKNGEEGYKKTLTNLPDLVVSDVIMPKMVGTELCAKIKANINTSHIPVVLLTARTSLLYRFEGLESGADDYISKPFDVKEFRLRINNLVEASKKLQEKFSTDKVLLPNEITVSSTDEKLLKKALEIVYENISNEQFNIHMFCTELGVSRTLLFSKIKAWTNFTPNDFIQELRMKRAAQLLEQNKLNISQIGYKVGFKNPKYFSKCFAKRFGKTPSQYAEKFTDTTV